MRNFLKQVELGKEMDQNTPKRKNESTKQSRTKKQKSSTDEVGKRKSFEKFEGMQKGETWKDFNNRIERERTTKLEEALDSLPRMSKRKKEYLKRRDLKKKERIAAKLNDLDDDKRGAPKVAFGEVVQQPPTLSLPVPLPRMNRALADMKSHEGNSAPKFKSVVPPKPPTPMTEEEKEMEQLRLRAVIAYKEAKLRKIEQQKRMEAVKIPGKKRQKKESRTFDGVDVSDFLGEFDVDLDAL